MVAVSYELSTTKFKSQFKQGLTKTVITRAGRLQEWSQGELRLCIGDFDCLRRRLTNKTRAAVVHPRPSGSLSPIPDPMEYPLGRKFLGARVRFPKLGPKNYSI